VSDVCRPVLRAISPASTLDSGHSVTTSTSESCRLLRETGQLPAPLYAGWRWLFLSASTSFGCAAPPWWTRCPRSLRLIASPTSINWLLHVSCGVTTVRVRDGVSGDEVDHRDVVAVGAIDAGSAFGDLDEYARALQRARPAIPLRVGSQQVWECRATWRRLDIAAAFIINPCKRAVVDGRDD